MKHFVFLFGFLVLIGFSLVLGPPWIAYGQYLGDKLPPNTMIIDETGEYVFPPSYVDFYYSNPRFEKYSVIAEHYRYDIPYMISNGTISKMSMDCNDVELILDIEPTAKQGWLTLALPRQIVDSQIGSDRDDTFIVLLDSKETKHSDIASEKLRLLIIPFSDNTSQINIIGVNYPEQMGENACNGKHVSPFSYLLSPLKQIKSGITLDKIKCKEELVFAQKRDSGKPICITPETKDVLEKRNWVELPPPYSPYPDHN
ncbi:hypothetical protein [Nitrosopumilus ureiphilus]|uniref:Uncharacterized protein n=1 Tax=Nitrosopumilus ureiphilus TaxID=1470067 RepID=A0A7D5M4Y6_9ARCH|nr:hypothetical protein [Nitrosopumilus ureiphilus]QLH06495.1 hypothetical protein C5F50_04975 [Nitrosopumilus ureiphilus]